MSNVTHKAVALSRHLADDLKKRFAPLEVAESFDTNGNPVVTVSDGTLATTERGAVLRILGDTNPVAKDILGNDAIHYTPHTLQICSEADDGLGNGNTGSYLTIQDILHLVGECGKRGMKLEWYVSANGDVPAVAEMIAGNLVATFSDLYWNIQRQS